MTEKEIIVNGLDEAWAREIVTLCQDFSGQCGLVILDPNSGDSLAINPRQPFLAASIIKLTILYHYGLLVQSRRLDPKQRVALTEEQKVPGFGVLRDMEPGLQPAIKDLVTLMIILSDNTATNMLIDLLGIEAMNETIDFLGLSDTRLRRKMFDWEAQEKGVENMITAQDTADLLLSLWNGDHLQPDIRAQLLAIMNLQRYRNKLPFLTADPERWANKTGDLDDYDHDVGYLLRDDTAVIVAFFSGGCTRRERVQLANEIGRLVDSKDWSNRARLDQSKGGEVETWTN